MPAALRLCIWLCPLLLLGRWWLPLTRESRPSHKVVGEWSHNRTTILSGNDHSHNDPNHNHDHERHEHNQQEHNHSGRAGLKKLHAAILVKTHLLTVRGDARRLQLCQQLCSLCPLAMAPLGGIGPGGCSNWCLQAPLGGRGPGVSFLFVHFWAAELWQQIGFRCGS